MPLLLMANATIHLSHGLQFFGMRNTEIWLAANISAECDVLAIVAN